MQQIKPFRFLIGFDRFRKNLTCSNRLRRKKRTILIEKKMINRKIKTHISVDFRLPPIVSAAVPVTKMEKLVFFFDFYFLLI